jgi:hypothetical protein
MGDLHKGDPLAYFGASVDAIQLKRPNVIREICICGHATSRHFEFSQDNFMCQVAKMYCPCKKIVPVLEVEDTRAFIFTTDGRGNHHALFRGLKRLNQMGKASTSLISNSCWICRKVSPIQPVPLSDQNNVSESPQARNAMLCEKCILRLMGFEPLDLSVGDSSENLPGSLEGPPEAPGIMSAHKPME